MNVQVRDYFTIKKGYIEYGGYGNFETALEFAKQAKKEHPDVDIIINKVTEIECEVTRI